MLKKHSLQNVSAIITRYFGGIKLGVKGLIDAYSESTLLAIQSSVIKPFEPHTLLKFSISYELYNILLARLAKILPRPDPVNTDFSSNITGEMQIPESLVEIVINELEAISAGEEKFIFSLEKMDDMQIG
jgi:putative IMPACT (imprinted ancient) family translation regulator